MYEDAHLEMAYEDRFPEGPTFEERDEMLDECESLEAIQAEEARQEAAAFYAEAEMAQWDDDPSPYHGDYSEM